MAKLLSISHTTYNRYESGLIEPDIRKLCKLSQIFHTSIDYLLMNDSHTYNEPVPTIITSELISKYNQLDQRGKEAVYATLLRECEFSKLESVEKYRLKIKKSML